MTNINLIPERARNLIKVKNMVFTFIWDCNIPGEGVKMRPCNRVVVPSAGAPSDQMGGVTSYGEWGECSDQFPSFQELFDVSRTTTPLTPKVNLKQATECVQKRCQIVKEGAKVPARKCAVKFEFDLNELEDWLVLHRDEFLGKLEKQGFDDLINKVNNGNKKPADSGGESGNKDKFRNDIMNGFNNNGSSLNRVGKLS